MFKKLWYVALAGLIAGCHSNPYDGLAGKFESAPPSQKPGSGQGAFVITAPTLVDVVEGQSGTANVSGTVDTGTPVLSFNNLPAFATYANGVLTLAPQLGDGSDPTNPSSTVREYQVQVVLSSSANAVAKVSQTMVIVVHHAATSLQVTYSDNNAQLTEGLAYSGTIQVQSTGSGTVSVSSAGLPLGVTISPVAGSNNFTISYTPPFSITTSANYTSYCYDQQFNNHLCNDLNFTLTLVDTHGDAQSVQVDWKVMDIRQNPQVIADPTIKGTLNLAEADIYVADPNGETVPQVTVQQPSNGTVTVTTTNSSPSSNPPYVMAHIDWTGTSSSIVGTKQTLQVQSCVYDMFQDYAQCVTTPVTVQF